MSKSRIKRLSAHLAEKPVDEVAAIIDRIMDQNQALMDLLQNGDSMSPEKKLATIERAFPKGRAA